MLFVAKLMLPFGIVLDSMSSAESAVGGLSSFAYSQSAIMHDAS